MTAQPQTINPSDDKANSITSTPTTDTQASSDTGKEESPLQALAKKLSLIKEEIVKENDNTATLPPLPPEEPKKEEPISPAPVLEEKPLETPVTPTPTVPLAEEKKGEPSPLPTAIDTKKEVTAGDIPLVADEVKEKEAEVSQADIPLVADEPKPKEAVASVLLPGAEELMPKSTLDQLYPEINQAPATVEPTKGEDAILDEGDKSQVAAEVVEAKTSKAGTYPLNINKIMEIAIERDASDIQISVGYPVMIRIDDIMLPVNEQIVSKENAEELIMPVLSEQKKELLEVNREVDLAYSTISGAKARFRINAYYSETHLTAAFRLIPSKIRTIEELDLPPIYNQIAKLNQGFVLVTGPTGHGKSTTLAAMIQSINTSRPVHIITIEDPIEYIFPPAKAVVDQREMHDDTHSWTVALKSALRQAPDVILVGEMRDYETIASAITLAETGHLVFATLHTNNAAQTIDRIIDVFPENQQAQVRTQLANIIEAVIAQRLIPLEGGGRKAVSEIMLGSPAVRNLIREAKAHQIDNVIRTSADVGMISLEQSLTKMVRDGLITMERALEYAVHPEEVVRLLKS